VFAPLVQKVRNVLSACSIGPSSRILVGVSGGVDSMSLLHILREMGEEAPHCLVVHLDHGIRGAESAADRRLVEETARDWGFSIVSTNAHLAVEGGRGGKVTEESARAARFTFFRLIAAGFKADAILLAHHRDDLAENLLFRLARSGLPESLPGMTRDSRVGSLRIIRPLLEISRSEIEEYARSNSVPSAIDSTNLSTDYTRNAIRSKVIPLLEELIPGAKANLGEAALLLASDNAEIARLAINAPEPITTRQRWGVNTLTRSRMLVLPQAFVRRILGNLSGNALSRSAWDSAAPLPAGLALDLPGGGRIHIDENTVVVASPWPSLNESLRLVVPGTAVLPDGSRIVVSVEDMPSSGLSELTKSFPSKSPWLEFADADKLSSDCLIVRPRRDGDRFRPIGSPGERKLQDFLTDAGVPREERDRIPIVESRDRILWVVGERLSDTFKLTSSTRRILRLVFHPSWDTAADLPLSQNDV
jgi:tRNA(Ile)-lysidine synthase